MEEQTGQPRPCKTDLGCDRPALFLENVDAWNIYKRVSDQLEIYPDKEHPHVALRVEAVKALIDLVGPDDPLETFDRVMLIHRDRYGKYD